MQGEYKFLDHTADIGIEVISSSLEGVYEIAGQALFDLILPGKGKSDLHHWVESKADDAEALLVNFLNDLLLQFEVHGLLFRTIKIRTLSSTSLVAETWCEKLDPEKSCPDTVVKAITWHNLKVEQRGNQWKGVVFLDL